MIWSRSRTLSVVGLVIVAVGIVWVDAATWNRDRVAAVGVCQDVASSRRVPDQQCAARTPGDRWVFYRAGSDAPGVGGFAGNGALAPPSSGGSVWTGGEPAGGGRIGGQSGGSAGSGASEGGGEEGGSGSGAGSGGGGGSSGGGGGGSSGGGGGGGGGE